MHSIPSARVAVWFLAIAAALTILNLAAPLFAPIILALVLGVVLSPFAGRIDRLGAPPALAALLTLLASLGVIVLLLFVIEPVLSEAVRRAPIIWEELRETISTVQSALHGLDDVSAQVTDALNDNGKNDAGQIVASAAQPVESAEAVKAPTAADAILYAPAYLARVMIFTGTLYFFLLSRREVYDWISRSELAASTADMLEAERDVSKYFLTITVINAAFGTLVALMLWSIGLPYAPLWGLGAFLANYILYLGPATFAIALVLGGIVTFDGPISFLPAAIFLAMNMTEGQFVTPSLVGRKMSVSPLLVFLSLVFWLWMWGPVGGVIAIPLLVWGLALRKRQKSHQSDGDGASAQLSPAQTST
ncbi:AI-2E family transporter [Pseudophaeobacter sp.]|uniref:AI-2E family transporter n=1 Tax=Pseudophaeobacter sp. TaxID=1971739 RepID=UPI00262E0502|nr:AI-2E family transporter [Pseudophaeobacter sp.]